MLLIRRTFLLVSPFSNVEETNMSREPPVPEHNQSPYPIAESPHQPRDHAAIHPGNDDEDSELSLADRASAFLHDLPSLSGRTLIGVGGAVALGAAATIGALLFAQREPRSSAGGTRRAATSKARKSAQSRGQKTTAKS
jgi:hypothetical protein